MKKFDLDLRECARTTRVSGHRSGVVEKDLLEDGSWGPKVETGEHPHLKLVPDQCSRDLEGSLSQIRLTDEYYHGNCQCEK
jgi:hypothetical protein